MVRSLQYAFLAIIVTTVGFSLYQWNASRASTQKTAPNNGLVGYWKLDEGTGTTTLDASGNNYTGTLTSGPTWVSGGKVNKSVSFDGTNDYITMGDQSLLEINNNSFSFGGWFYINAYPAVNNRMFLITKGGSVIYYEYELSVSGYTSNHLSANIFNEGLGNYIITQSTTVPPLNTWFHVMVVWDKDAVSMKLYYDGVLESTSNATSGAIHSTRDANFEIGRRGDNAEQTLNGLADEVRVYNRALSATEIMNFFNTAKLNVSPVSNLTSGLVGYWTFDGKDTPWSSSSAGTATDRSGNSNTGTLTNMSQSTSPTIGKLGQALNFDGSNDYVTVPHNSVLNFAYNQDFSVNTWVKIPSTQNNTGGVVNIILQKWVNTGGYPYAIRLYNQSYGVSADRGKIFAVRYDGTNIPIVTSLSAVNDNAWHLLSFTKNGSTLSLYIDGVVSGTATDTTTGTTTNSNPLYIGIEAGTTYPLTGQVDDTRIYNRALSITEIQSLYDLGASDKVNSSVSQNQGTGRLDSGLVGYWKLDENSGVATVDSSTNANHGTMTNGPTWTTGRVSYGVDFDGTDDYITAPDADTLDVIDSTNFTLTGWFNRDTFTTDDTIIAKSNGQASSDTGYNAYIDDATDKLTFVANDGTDQYKKESVSTFTATGWHHFALVWDESGSSNTKLYIDGLSEATTDTGTFANVNSLANALTFRIGAESDSGNPFDGKIDEVRMYNRTLSADEVSQLYRLTTPTGVDTSLKGYWSFNGPDVSGTTAYDRSGSANNGTLTNGPTATIGKLGQALNFDGTDDYTTTPDSATLDAGDTADLTLTGWFYRNTATTDDTIIAKRNGIANTDDGYILYIDDSTDKLTFETSENSGTDEYQLESTTSFTTPGWYHYAVVWDQTSAANSEIYLSGVTNGATDTGTIGNLGDLSNALSFNIGSESDGGNPFDGKLDEPRIYNRALSATEISALYNSGR